MQKFFRRSKGDLHVHGEISRCGNHAITEH